MLDDRRLRVLRGLGERAAGVDSAEAVCSSAIEVLSSNSYDFPFALLFLLDDDGVTARLRGAAGLERGSTAAPESVVAGSRDDCWQFAASITERATRVIDDLAERFGPLPAGPWDDAATVSAFVLPLLGGAGAQRPLGFLVAGLSPRLAFDDNYRSFLDLTADQIAAAIGHARAYEEERNRAQALAELDHAKTSFFSNISHEFRTPLTLLSGPLDELLRGGDLQLAVREQLELVQRSSRRLLKLVNTLLEFSRIEAQRVEARFRPINLAELTGELASLFRSAAERAGLELVVDCPPLPEPVWVDLDMWEKVVLNLLSNAFKFTFEGVIQVSQRSVGPTIELTVRDTGTGIPKVELPRLFERFHRVHGARARTHEGSGMASLWRRSWSVCTAGRSGSRASSGGGAASLWSCRAAPGICRRSTSWRRAEPGHPTICATAAPMSRRSSDGCRTPPPCRSTKILRSPMCRDPSPPMVWFWWRTTTPICEPNLRRLLGRRYEVVDAANGAEALRAAQSGDFDLVLADVMMPHLDGFELLQALRENPATAAVPVILLSARAGEESRVEGMEAGADDYLVKPFAARELLARVEAHIELRRERERATASLRESEERFRTMADNAPVMVWVTEADGMTSFVSRSWARFTGVDDPEADDFGWRRAVHPEDRDNAQGALRAARLAREPVRREYRLRRSDGAYRWVIDSATPRFDAGGELKGYTGSVLDITDRRRMEEALRDADRRKDEFLALLAHELRNPLAPIQSAVQVLHFAAADTDDGREARAVIERQLRHLTRLVDDLLDVSRITRGKIELAADTVDLAEVARRAVEISRPLIEARDHELGLSMPSEPLLVRGDAVRLVQVVDNLLNNAAKYTPDGGRIVLEIAREGDEATIRVRDDGLGVDPRLLPHVIDLFTQADASLDRSQGGLGIGLTLVRQLVERHQGRVEAKSEGLGRGSEFVVMLPLAAAGTDAGSAKEIVVERAATPSLRVLVVEDSADAAEMMRLVLELDGHQAVAVGDGTAALEAVADFRPDVVLCDLGLPGISGYEVARRLEQQGLAGDLVLIALTGYGHEEARREAREAGFDHHLVKPIEPQVLRRLLRSMTVRRRGGSAD